MNLRDTTFEVYPIPKFAFLYWLEGENKCKIREHLA